MKVGNGFTSHLRRAVLLCFLVFPVLGTLTPAQAEEKLLLDDLDLLNGQENARTRDPLEPLNRAFFHFNDRLYFWVLKPVAKGYSQVIAEDVRVCVRDFFNNLLAPVRIANNLLQGKVKNSGIETARFLINSTMGIAGLADPAKDMFSLTARDEDFGQTLGFYGFGDGIYICWPFLGPSNLRDTVGLVTDSFLSPLAYLTSADPRTGFSLQAGREVNHTSLTMGDYEDFKDAAIDPYVSLRDAYRQHRQKKIHDTGGDSLYLSLGGEEPGTEYAGFSGKAPAGPEGTQSEPPEEMPAQGILTAEISARSLPEEEGGMLLSVRLPLEPEQKRN